MIPQSSNLRQRLISGSSWAFVGKIIAAVTGLAVSALLARLLTPKEMGAYFLTFSLVSVAALVAQLGLNQTVVRLVAESLGTGRPGRARAAIRIVFRYGAGGALVVAGLLAFGVGRWLAQHVFASPLIAGVMGLAGVWVVILALRSLLAETFRGFHDIRFATIFGGLVTSVLSAGLFAGLWIMQGHSQLSEVLTLSITAGGTSTIIGGVLLRWKVKYLEKGGTLKRGEILSIAWPLLITNLTLFVLTQADLWIMGAFRPHEEVAIYGAAVKLVGHIAVPLIIVNSVLPPIIAEMHAQKEKKKLEKALRTAATLAGIPALIVLLVLIFWGKPILGLIYGNFYREGATVLILLSLGQFVNVWVGSCGFTLMMTGHQATMMAITVASGVLTVAGGIWLVRDYGAIGVASASGVTMILQNIVMLWFVKKRVGVWTHAQLASLSAVRQIFLR